MRGDVYRLGRRRAGSVVLALGAALTLALGWAYAATAKPGAPHAAAKPAAVRVHAGAHLSTTAHAAGHKIA